MNCLAWNKLEHFVLTSVYRHFTHFVTRHLDDTSFNRIRLRLASDIVNIGRRIWRQRAQERLKQTQCVRPLRASLGDWKHIKFRSCRRISGLNDGCKALTFCCYHRVWKLRGRSASDINKSGLEQFWRRCDGNMWVTSYHGYQFAHQHVLVAFWATWTVKQTEKKPLMHSLTSCYTDSSYKKGSTIYFLLPWMTSQVCVSK